QCEDLFPSGCSVLRWGVLDDFGEGGFGEFTRVLVTRVVGDVPGGGDGERVLVGDPHGEGAVDLVEVHQGSRVASSCGVFVVVEVVLPGADAGDAAHIGFRGEFDVDL